MLKIIFFKQNIYYFIIFLNKTPLYKAKTLHGVFIFIAEGVLDKPCGCSLLWAHLFQTLQKFVSCGMKDFILTDQYFIAAL